MTKPINVAAYIAHFTETTQQLLEQVRTAIKEAAPQATEVISYAMPAFKIHGVLVYFAAYANHIGFYPTGSAIEHFKDEIAIYKNSKGAVQFPLNKPLPLALIKKIVEFRVKEDEKKAKAKRK